MIRTSKLWLLQLTTHHPLRTLWWFCTMQSQLCEIKRFFPRAGGGKQMSILRPLMLFLHNCIIYCTLVFRNIYKLFIRYFSAIALLIAYERSYPYTVRKVRCFQLIVLKRETERERERENTITPRQPERAVKNIWYCGIPPNLPDATLQDGALCPQSGCIRNACAPPLQMLAYLHSDVPVCISACLSHAIKTTVDFYLYSFNFRWTSNMCLK